MLLVEELFEIMTKIRKFVSPGLLFDATSVAGIRFHSGIFRAPVDFCRVAHLVVVKMVNG